VTRAREVGRKAAFAFCGNTVTRHDLQLRRGSALVPTYGDVLRDPDDVGDGGTDGPRREYQLQEARWRTP